MYMKIISLFSGGAMLDVGCNDGYFMRHFNWKFDKYLGIDMFSIYEYLRTEDITGYNKDGKIYIKQGFLRIWIWRRNLILFLLEKYWNMSKM